MTPAAAPPLIHVLHENDAWVAPLRAAFADLGLAHREWFVDEGALDLAAAPPPGVFYNRMSASSHTRGHVYAPEHTACVLAWLEAHGRRVLNGSRALRIELSKVAQYASLETLGVPTPRTVATVGRAALLDAARAFEGRPFITKHNRAGKGLGVRLFRSHAALRAYAEGPDFEPSRDGVTLLQEYVEAPEPFITRVEFVGRELLYAVRVDTSEGFELCPADACNVGDAFCPVGETVKARPKFEVLDGFDHALVPAWRRFMELHDIHVAAFELITDARGTSYTYDVNTNTNYNAEAEAAAGGRRRGMHAIAAFLGAELAREYRAIVGANDAPGAAAPPAQ